MSVDHWTDFAMSAGAQSGTRGSGTMRRAFDLAIALTALVVLAPLLVIIAMAVWLDSPGPIIYRQRRMGLRGREFLVNKFRSMRADADPRPHREYIQQHLAGENRAGASGGGLYKLVVDERVTRVGRILRRTSLDELPQLWNVVRGEMSLVGPRPAIPYEVERYPDWYHARFAVKPGLTGLWQVSGRNERTYEEMVCFDIEYTRRQTLRLDLIILLRTVWVVLRRRGAV